MKLITVYPDESRKKDKESLLGKKRKIIADLTTIKRTRKDIPILGY